MTTPSRISVHTSITQMLGRIDFGILASANQCFGVAMYDDMIALHLNSHRRADGILTVRLKVLPQVQHNFDLGPLGWNWQAGIATTGDPLKWKHFSDEGTVSWGLKAHHLYRYKHLVLGPLSSRRP